MTPIVVIAGHRLPDGMADRYLRQVRESGDLDARTVNYLRAENDRYEWSRLDHIARQVGYAQSGGWG